MYSRLISLFQYYDHKNIINLQTVFIIAFVTDQFECFLDRIHSKDIPTLLLKNFTIFRQVYQAKTWEFLRISESLKLFSKYYKAPGIDFTKISLKNHIRTPGFHIFNSFRFFCKPNIAFKLVLSLALLFIIHHYHTKKAKKGN